MKDINTTQELSKAKKIRQHNKNYYERNKEKKNAQSREYYQKNKETIKQKQRERGRVYYLKNKDKLLSKHKKNKADNLEKYKVSARHSAKKYYQNNKQIIAVRSKVYVEKNREQANSRNKEWCNNNKERISKRSNERYRHKKVTNPQYCLALMLRGRFRDALKAQRVTSKLKAVTLIGCTIEECKQHIEGQWLPGMNWSNNTIRGWHIDHIKPVNTFDLTDPEQQKQCFHYTNLRPLWGKDNQSRPRDGSDCL